MQKLWVLKSMPCCQGLEGGLDLHPLVRAILAGRSIDSVVDARRFLSPSLSDMHDPLLLKGVPEAVERLLRARRDRETVCIYGDYDVDGITGTCLLVSFLRAAGFSCRYFIPNRFDDGYGLGREALARIRSEGASLVVSVDCGILAVEEAAFCREIGLDLIVIDHHLPGAVLPDAVAVVNPLQPGCCYPFKVLAGVGVAFNVLVALRAALRSEGVFRDGAEPDLRQYLDLVALGTVADIVPLTGQNRIYVTHGLRQLADSLKPGICSLKQVAGITGRVSCGQVGFRLAPRLNAAGRLESAVPGVELLLATQEQMARAIAADLDSANAERQAVEKSIFDDAVRMLEDAGFDHSRRSIVLAHDTWHQGVVGIVASRLVERYHRPTILLAIGDDGIVKGSGRSISGFHLLNALKACHGHLLRYGGHRHAAGVSLKQVDLTAFAEVFEAEAARLLADEDLIPRLEIDAEAAPGEITIGLAHDLARLEPFGAGNPEPVLLMRGLTVSQSRVVGEGHLRLQLNGEGKKFGAIAFRMAQREVPDTIDIAFFPEINEWNGSSSLQLRIKDLRPAE